MIIEKNNPMIKLIFKKRITACNFSVLRIAHGGVSVYGGVSVSGVMSVYGVVSAYRGVSAYGEVRMHMG